MNLINDWNEWFAGLVDGDGCFYINKKNEISFEVTTASNDVRILYDIKNKLKAGSVKLRSGSKSVRYRVKARLVIEDIVHRLNGKLRHPIRLKQFERACQILTIPVKPTPSILDPKTGYLAGLIDSDGTISISVFKTTQVNSQKSGTAGKIIRLMESRGFHQLSFKVTSIYKPLVLILQESYRFGQIYSEKANRKNKNPNKKYSWTIRNSDEFSLLYDYLKHCPLKSVKMHRIRLAVIYFQYKQLKYHLKEPETIEYKRWVKFCKSWFRYTS